MKSPLPSDTKKYSSCSHLKVNDLTLIGLMAAILLVVQVSIAFIPNVELVSLLILLYTLVFGFKTLYIIYIFVFLEGMIYGFGIWWFHYLYIWAILFILGMIYKKNNSKFFWSIILGLYGLLFGALCAISYFIVGGWSMGFSYWIAGIPFDLIHGISNFIITLLLFKPLYHILQYINRNNLSNRL